MSFLFSGLDVSIEVPRRCGRQLYRVNTPASSAEEYFRVAIFIPFLDSFLLQMNERLLAHRNLLKCFSSLLPRDDHVEFDATARQQATILHCTYSKHLDCGEAEFHGEMQLYYKHVRNMKEPPTSPLEALKVRHCL